MESNVKTVSATDTPVSSLASSFVQLEIISHSTGGPINRLPNEMMEQIVAKLDDDGNSLVRLRLVSTKWNSVVQHYCQKKKSLFVNCKYFHTPGLKNCAPLIVRLKTVVCFGMMLKLFPNIEQLSVNFRSLKDYTQILTFSVCINSLQSLKQLTLYDNALKAVPHLSQALSQLENIGLFGYFGTLNAADMRRFVSNLGPNCVGVFIRGIHKFKYRHIAQYHQIKPNLFASLTHLRMFIPGGSDRALHLLIEHATLLEYLHFDTYFDHSLVMSPNAIRDLGKLVHLTYLRICKIEMDIAELDETSAQIKLASLTSVLTCKLFVKNFGPLMDGDKFTRVLSVILPKLINLKLYIAERLSTCELFLLEIQQNLDRFSNLRKHKIAFSNLL